MNAVVMREKDAVAVGATNAVTAEIRTRPGAAQLVAQQAPIALDPYTSENAHVDAPEDPKNHASKRGIQCAHNAGDINRRLIISCRANAH